VVVLQAAQFGPEGKVSPHFLWKEVTCRCGCGFTVVNQLLVYNLERLRAGLGHRPVKVYSWCRCPEYNEKVGGVQDSFHTYGLAADIACDGVPLDKLAQQAGKLFDGIGVYRAKGFVHVDVRGWPARWDE
jgi:uncharacterized protein YcbK (DUF882 family)